MAGVYRTYHRPTAYVAIQKRLDALGRVQEPRRLARDISKELYEGNRLDRMREVDRHGRPLKDWRVRTGKYKGALGPTLLPFGLQSDAIRGFFIRRQDTETGWILTAGIRSAKAAIFVFHAEGLAGKGRGGGTTGIVRDIMGVTPQTKAALYRLFKNWAREVNRA